MKTLNFNAVRLSHYPTHHRFMEICDAAGLYVCDEANIETHGFQVAGQPVAYLAHLPEYVVTILDYTTLPHYTPHYTLLYYITLHYTSPHGTLLRCTLLHYTTLHYFRLCTILQKSTPCCRILLRKLYCLFLYIALHIPNAPHRVQT